MNKKKQIINKTTSLQVVSFCLAGVFVVLSFTQVFDLAGLIEILEKNTTFGLPHLSTFLAIGIIALEISALPFLLGLNFGRLMTVYSLLAGGLSLFFWFFVVTWAVVSDFSGSLGLLGSKIPLSASWWLGIILAILITLFSLVFAWRKNKIS